MYDGPGTERQRFRAQLEVSLLIEDRELAVQGAYAAIYNAIVLVS
jgi:hypothetical protein